MAGVQIRKVGNRTCLSFVVRYRLGGRDTPLRHAGTFRTLPEAERCRDVIAEKLASCVPPPSGRIGTRKVYFARLGSLIKIGMAVDPERRVRELNAELLAIEEGGRSRERELHERFAGLRERGEWFRQAPELLSYIAEREALA